MQRVESKVEAVINAARELSPAEQLEVIEALIQHLRASYSPSSEATAAASGSAIPAHVKRTPAFTSLERYAADFWLEDESADDVNDFVSHQ